MKKRSAPDRRESINLRVLVPDHAEGRLTELPIPESSELVQLASLFADLSQVQKYCEQLRPCFEKEDYYDSKSVAAGNCAVISYARCFATGVRDNLTLSVFAQADSELLALHEHFLHLRNKHIAHSVNDMEFTCAVVSWEKQRGRYYPAAVGTYHMTAVGLSEHEYYDMLKLTNWLLPRLWAAYKRECKRLFEVVKSMEKKQLQAFGSMGHGAKRFESNQFSIARPRCR